MVKITFSDMAESLYLLRKRYGQYYSPDERTIYDYAVKIKLYGKDKIFKY